MHLHHEGALYLRQFHQQQGIMFRIRSCGRDRAQPHLHADEGGAGSEAGRGRTARAAAGIRCEDAGPSGELRPDRGDARSWDERDKDLPQDRRFPQHMVQVPVADASVATAAP